MNDKSTTAPTYIKTPLAKSRPQKVSVVLEKRMKEFLRQRRRLLRGGGR